MARLVANGDSLTYFGGAGTDYASQAADLLGLTPVLLAYNGKETSAMASDYITYSADHNVCIIEGGVNDILNGRSVASIQANLLSMVNTARSRAVATIVLITPVPWRTYAGWTQAGEDKALQIIQYMQYDLERITGGMIRVVDSRSILGVAGGNTLNPLYDSGDGIHLNQTGQDALRDGFLASL